MSLRDRRFMKLRAVVLVALLLPVLAWAQSAPQGSEQRVLARIWDGSNVAVNDAALTFASVQPVVVGAFAEADAAALQSVSGEGDAAVLKTNLQGRLLVEPSHPNRVSCVLTTAATTSTLITGCGAPGAGLSIYITDISVYGGVALGATAAATIQHGTGGSCGTGTTITYYCQHGATSGCEAHFITPKKAAANSEVCLLDATTGTKFISISGYIAP